jgi:hypothetical protein
MADPSRCGPREPVPATVVTLPSGATRMTRPPAGAADHAVDEPVWCHEQLDPVDVGEPGDRACVAVDPTHRVPVVHIEVPGRVAVDSVRGFDVRKRLNTSRRNVDPNDTDAGRDRRDPDRVSRRIDNEICWGSHLGHH